MFTMRVNHPPQYKATDAVNFNVTIPCLVLSTIGDHEARGRADGDVLHQKRQGASFVPFGQDKDIAGNSVYGQIRILRGEGVDHTRDDQLRECSRGIRRGALLIICVMDLKWI